MLSSGHQQIKPIHFTFMVLGSNFTERTRLCHIKKVPILIRGEAVAEQAIVQGCNFRRLVAQLREMDSVQSLFVTRF